MEQKVALSQASTTPDTIDKFRALMRDAPDLALWNLSATYRLMEDRHFGGNAQMRSLAGGAPEWISWALYNTVGAAYPSLTREQKNLALGHTLAIMDNVNYLIVNGEEGVGHTTGIREPLYLGEICTARPLYWPGLDEGKHIIKQQRGNFDRIRADLITEDGKFIEDKVNSDFLVAYAFLRKDMSDFGERFVEVFDRNFIDRTITAIVKFSMARVEKEEDIRIGLDRLGELLPESLHDKIEPASKVQDWVDKGQFR
jgi:hypothetical protein